MPDVPPTTSETMLDDDALYERAFGSDEPAICGAELSNGGTCERLADECPYEAHHE